MSKEATNDKYWITVSHTVNLGNFNSVKVEAGYSKTYTEKDPTKLIEADTEALAAVLSKKAKKLKKNK